MSSEDQHKTSKEELFLEDDNVVSGTEPPPSNGDQSSSELSEDLEGDESSDDDKEQKESSPVKGLRSPEAQKRESDSIFGGQWKTEDEDGPSTSKKVKPDAASERQENDVSSEGEGTDREETGCSKLKKAKKDLESSANTGEFPLVSNPEERPSTPSQDFGSPEKPDANMSPITPTPILRSILGSPVVPLSPIKDAPMVAPNASVVQNTAERSLVSVSTGSTESQAPAPPSALLDILAKPPIIPPPIGSVDNASRVHNQPEERRAHITELQRHSPLLRGLLNQDRQPSNDTQETGSHQPPANTFEPLKRNLLSDPPIGTRQMPEMQEDNYFEQESSPEDDDSEDCSRSSIYSSPEHKPEVGEEIASSTDFTGRMHDSEQLSVSDGSLDAKASDMPRPPSEDVEVSDGDRSSPPSSPSWRTTRVLGDGSNSSGQLQAAEDKTTSQSLTDATQHVKESDVESKDEVKNNEQQISPHPSNTSTEPYSVTDEITSRRTQDTGSKQLASETDSVPSGNLVETEQISYQTSHSSSVPDDPPIDSKEVSVDVHSISEKPKGMSERMKMSDNLEGVKLEDSSRRGTPGRKTRHLKETNQSSGSKTASVTPDVPTEIGNDGSVFKKPPLTPQRMQKVKSKLEDMKLKEPGVTDSPTRRSARIQSKESGAVEKRKEEKIPVGLAALGGKKGSEKSKSSSLDRATKSKKEGENSRSVSQEDKKLKTRSQESAPKEDDKKSRTRSQQSTPAAMKPKKREDSTTGGSREHSSSEESVAGRTRGSKSRLTSTSSNSEADKTEEEEKEKARAKRKSRKDSSK